MAAAAAPSDAPMLAHLINRLRLLRKKRSRITKIEDGLAQGKLLNSDQEEILRSKPVVLALIQELEDLRALSAVPAPAVPVEVPEKSSQDVVVAAVGKGEKARTAPVLASVPEPLVQENVQEVSKVNPDQSIAVDDSPKIAFEKLEQSLVEAPQETQIAEAGEKQQNQQNLESGEEEWHVQRRPFQVIRDRKKLNNDWDDSGRGYGGVYPSGSRGVQGQYYKAGNYSRNDAYVVRGDQTGRGVYINGQDQGQNYNTKNYHSSDGNVGNYLRNAAYVVRGDQSGQDQNYNTRNYHSSDGNVGRGGHGGQRGRRGYSNGQGQFYDTGSNQSSDGNVGRAGVGAQRGRGGNSNGESQYYQLRAQNDGSTRGRGSGRGSGHSNDVKQVPSVPVAEQI